MPKKHKSGGKKDTTPRNRKSLGDSFISSNSAYNTPLSARNTNGNSPHPSQHFSLRDEVLNTEKHHEKWTPSKRLRDQKISFVSAGTTAPLEDAEIDDPTAPLEDIELDESLDNLDAEDGAMAQMTIDAHDNTTLREDLDIDVDIDAAVAEAETTMIEDVQEEDEVAMLDRGLSEESAEPQEDPLASMFFIDTQGDSGLAFKGPKSTPAPRPASPTPSDSSEEVVFRGRGVTVRDDPPIPKSAPKQQPPPVLTPAPTPARSIAPARGALQSLMDAIEHEEPQPVVLAQPTVAAPTSWNASPPKEEVSSHWKHENGSVSQTHNNWPTAQSRAPQPRLDPDLSAVKPSSRKSKKSRKKQNKLMRPELDPEDELLQDYIDNMDPEEKAAIGLGLYESDDSTDELFNKLLDQEDDHEQINPKDLVGMEIDTSSGSDSWGTDNGEDDDDDDNSDEEDDDDEDDSDYDSSELEDRLEYTERQQWEDEADLRQRQQDAMTDEELARIFAKQEELGLGADEMLLFDDSGFGDLGAARTGIARMTGARSRPKTSARKTKRSKKDHFPDASLMADVLEEDPYGGFDIMDFDRPSLRSKTKGRKSAGPLPEELGISDEEIIADLQSAWANDRSKKASRKAVREEERMLGLLGSGSKSAKKKGNKFKPDMSVRYEEGISMSQVRIELREFLDSNEWSTKQFPPMLKQDRKVLHELANHFNLKSKSVGAGKNRAPVLIKTSRTLDFTEENFTRAQNFVSRSFFRQPGKKGKTDKFAVQQRNRRGGGGGGGATGYADGQVVGAAAPEIGASNFGRKLMEKMGWSAGMALGKEGSAEGRLLVPVEARIKSGKAGLG